MTQQLVLRVAQAAARRLERVGIAISVFFLVREGELAPQEGPRDGRYGTFPVVTLMPSDIDEIVRLDPAESYALARARFDAGNLCFGLRDGARLVAKMWCDVRYLNHEPIWRELAPHEGYLFAAYTAPAYRGHQLAPRLRLACYEVLRRAGRTSLISHTLCCNIASRRFKAKLGAVEEGLYMHLCLFRKWSATWKLRGRCAARPNP